MDIYSAWPLLGLLCVVLAIVATPLFKAADSPPIPASNRIRTLDGLRGFLALSVFFHHSAVYHSYIQGRPWGPPPDRFYALLGPFGVAMFFMITGFLFWGQVLEKKGRPDWIKLYVGRIFRIGPLYVAVICMMIFSVFVLTDFKLREPLTRVFVEVIRWLFLGVTTGGHVNGLAQTGDLVGNVTWTLRFEWMFYSSLLVTAFFARQRLSSWLLPLATLAISMFSLVLTHDQLRPAVFVALFSMGMITAASRPALSKFNFDRPIVSAVAASILLIILVEFDTTYAAVPAAILGASFFLIANGTSLFGLLNTVAARRLGDVSFGIYLIQGLVLAAVFASPQARTFALSSSSAHWALTGIAVVSLVAIATVAHVLVERPGIDLGRMIVTQLTAARSGGKKANIARSSLG